MTLRASTPVRGVALLLAIAACAPSSPAQRADTTRVWVNTSSGVYHCPGTQYYGTTARGRYLSEAAARDSGYRPATRGGCGLLPASQAAPAIPALPDSGPRAPVRATTPCTVRLVVDGDTIQCSEHPQRIRLIGVDAPESDQRPFGEASAGALASYLPVGTPALLERDVDTFDSYGRILGYVWVQGIQVNWLLLRLGWSVQLTIAPNVQYADPFRAAVERARTERRGLWARDGFRCLPSDHRRGVW
jgi:micrococcal nuclease